MTGERRPRAVRRPLRVLFATATLWALWSAAGATGPAPAVKPAPQTAPQRVLFVGNSYLSYGGGVHVHVRQMAVADNPTTADGFAFRSMTVGGGRLDQHDVAAYLEPGRLGVAGSFDAVVMQDHSSSSRNAANRARFRQAVVAAAIRVRAGGGLPVLYMTHAYVAPHAHVDPRQTRDLERLYVAVGNEVGALVAPVGLAFAEAYRRRPNVLLQNVRDGSHPEPAGTYLAAATVYATLYGRSPVGNAYDYAGRIDRETMVFLQTVAQDVVADFFRRPGP